VLRLESSLGIVMLAMFTAFAQGRVVTLVIGVGVSLAAMPVLGQPAMLDPVGALGSARAPMNYVEQQNPKHHGYILDMRNRIQIVEAEGWMTLHLHSRERIEGGPFTTYNPMTGGEDPIFRHETLRPLMRIRSEVLIPAAPNYVRNPGQRYRISMEGLTIAPDYTRVFEVMAADALDTITKEWETMMLSLSGIERKAMEFGRILALQLMNESGYLPARVPITVLRSGGGLFRIAGPSMGRMDVGRLERFGEVSEGGQFRDSQSQQGELTSLTLDEVKQQTRDSDKAGVPQMGRAHVQRQYSYSRDDLRPQSARKDMFRQPGEQQPRSQQPGARGRALTVPEVDYPAIGAADMENFKLLTGDSESALTARGMTRD
jgi:hypothetical protein